MKSKKVTSSETLMDTGGFFSGVIINTDGSNDGVVVVYDGNPGTVKFEFTCIGADKSYGAIFAEAIDIDDLLRVEISGTNATCIMLYKRSRDK